VSRFITANIIACGKALPIVVIVNDESRAFSAAEMCNGYVCHLRAINSASKRSAICWAVSDMICPPLADANRDSADGFTCQRTMEGVKPRGAMPSKPANRMIDIKNSLVGHKA
jgi:hypothetical protein